MNRRSLLKFIGLSSLFPFAVKAKSSVPLKDKIASFKESEIRSLPVPENATELYTYANMLFRPLYTVTSAIGKPMMYELGTYEKDAERKLVKSMWTTLCAQYMEAGDSPEIMWRRIPAVSSEYKYDDVYDESLDAQNYQQDIPYEVKNEP